jgi:hypothetical protein
MTPTYEIQQLLYEVLDRLERIEKTLGVQSTTVDEDGGVKFRVVNTDPEKVIEFPTPE